MNKEVEEAKEYLKYISEQDKIDDVALNESNAIETILNYIQELEEENEQLRTVLNSIRDELVGDRMEQLDDYVIYLQTKYLEILGENDDE